MVLKGRVLNFAALSAKEYTAKQSREIKATEGSLIKELKCVQNHAYSFVANIGEDIIESDSRPDPEGTMTR